MSNIRVNAITDEAGTGAPDFPNGYTVAGAVPAAGFSYAAVSGATQALDVGAHNFFDAGTLTADTTISFTNVPTEAQWTYTAGIGAKALYSLLGPVLPELQKFLVSDSRGVHFSPDGTKLYLITNPATYYSHYVFEFVLSTPWDITTNIAGYAFMLDGQDNQFSGVSFKNDGTKMYVIGNTADRIFQYSLSTAWNLSTASYDNVSFYVGSQDANPTGIYFKPDGTTLYMVGFDSDRVHQYSLSTPWSVSTASYSSLSFSVASQEVNPFGVTFKPDGTKMYVGGQTGQKLYQYTLSTPWAVNTASYDSVSRTMPSYVAGIFFSTEGEYLYATQALSPFNTYRYGASEIFSVALDPSIQNPPSIAHSLYDQVAYTFFTADAGTTVKLINEQVL